MHASTAASTSSPFHDAPALESESSLQHRVPNRISHYELLSRMGFWSHKLSDYAYVYRRHPPVYSRDFAYDDSSPVVVRMARSNIGDVTAKDYAMYVCRIL